MSNSFEFAIVAQDEFSEQFKMLARAATRAADNLNSAEKKALGSPARRDLPQQAKIWHELAASSRLFAANIGAAASPLSTLLGIGAAGSVAGGIGAALAETRRWADTAWSVQRTSSIYNVNAQTLQQWAGAARMAGVSGDAMTQTFQRIAQIQQAARYGRGGAERIFMLNHGIDLNDTAHALDQIADVMRASDAGTRRTIADVLGIDPSAIALLDRGSQAIAALRQQVQRLGATTSPEQIKRATELGQAWAQFGLAVDGAMNRIGSATSPAATRAVQGLTGLVQHPEGTLLSMFPAPLRAQWAAGGALWNTGQRWGAGLLGAFHPVPIHNPRASGVVTDEATGLRILDPGARADFMEAALSGSAQFSSARLARQLMVGNDVPQGAVDVHVKVDANAPTTVTTRSTGGVRVVHSSPLAGP